MFINREMVGGAVFTALVLILMHPALQVCVNIYSWWTK